MASEFYCGFVCNEGTPGTAETPDAAEAIKFSKLDFRPMIAAGEQPVYWGKQDRKKAGRVRRHWWQVDWELPVLAAASAGVQPEIAQLLYSAGMDGTEDAGVSWIYDPFADPNGATARASHTIAKEMTEDGIYLKTYGSRAGNLVFSMGDQGLMLSGQSLGAWAQSTPIDQGANTSPTLNAGLPLVQLDSSSPFALQDGYNPPLYDIGFSFPMVARLNPDHGAIANGGNRLPAIVGWPKSSPVTGFALVELEDITAHDYFTKLMAGTVDATDRAIKFSEGSRYMTATFRDMQYKSLEIIDQEDNCSQVRINWAAYDDGTNPSCSLMFG